MGSIRYINVTKKIDGVSIVKGINFDINKGEIFGLLGPNGAGKSTLMKMAVGLSSITEGDIHINGISVKENFSNISNAEKMA